MKPPFGYLESKGSRSRIFIKNDAKKKMTIPFLKRARSSDDEQLWRRVGHQQMRRGLVNKKANAMERGEPSRTKKLGHKLYRGPDMGPLDIWSSMIGHDNRRPLLWPRYADV